jgi:GT2 family glycosyltransferase
MTSVSVIIPAYNAASVMSTVLASVAAQTRQPDQVIVVDDGSTDSTAAAAQRWSAMLPITVVQLEENVGEGKSAGGARAAAIEHADGDLIALVDADDYWLPDHLSVMLREHREHGGLITANCLLWVPDAELGRTPSAELVPVPRPRDQRSTILSENFVFVSTLFTRDLYDQAGGFRNIRCEDWDLWIRMVRCGATVHIPDQVTVLYRQAPDSVSGLDKLLIGDVDLLTELLSSTAGQDREVVERALQRRQAKTLYLEGLDLARAGDTAAARRAWWKSIKTDPSLRSNNAKQNGRVNVRAAACIVAPRVMVQWRGRRQSDPSRAVGNTSTAGRPR